MMKVLFVCHGNICRSTMAQYVFLDMARRAGREHEFEVDSAGTSREEIGNDMYPPAKRCLAAHGIPFERHFAAQAARQACMYGGNPQNIVRKAGSFPVWADLSLWMDP